MIRLGPSAPDHPTLGDPIAVYHDTVACDRGQHEVTVTTDGQRAYAESGTGRGAVEVTGVARDGVVLTATCGYPTGGHWITGPTEPEPCDGQATWRLDAPGCWTTDPAILDLLADYGTPMDQA